MYTFYQLQKIVHEESYNHQFQRRIQCWTWIDGS